MPTRFLQFEPFIVELLDKGVDTFLEPFRILTIPQSASKIGTLVFGEETFNCSAKTCYALAANLEHSHRAPQAVHICMECLVAMMQLHSYMSICRTEHACSQSKEEAS